MRLAIIDLVRWDYTVRTPLERPLGGSQSAICYLSVELAKLGHEVFLANQHPQADYLDGVYHTPIQSLPIATLRSMDAVVVQNNASPALELRNFLTPEQPLILWTQHAHDQPGMQKLRDPNVRGAFSHFAFVSDWQRDQFVQEFSVPRSATAVLRNAISPPFLASESRPFDWSQPRMAYTSTPFRGLNWLLESIFPQIRAAIPSATLDIYSSMAVYQVAGDKDQADFGALYDLARTMPGVNYIGSVAQARLAEALAGTWLLSYPNHFAETSCISVMEALAAGCDVVTSALGALPETLAGLGTPIELTGDASAYCDRFAQAVIEKHALAMRDPRAYQALREQRIAVARRANWAQRAQDWTDCLARWIR
jgi:glycosyltransferase involved in cell wall biosynthesis